jgi:hypothetical protein
LSCQIIGITVISPYTIEKSPIHRIRAEDRVVDIEEKNDQPTKEKEHGEM